MLKYLLQNQSNNFEEHFVFNLEFSSISIRCWKTPFSLNTDYTRMEWHCSEIDISTNKLLNEYLYNLFLTDEMQLIPFESMAIVTSVLYNCWLLSSVQSLSRVRLFATPWIAARQASLSITNSRSSPRLTSIESVVPYTILVNN